MVCDAGQDLKDYNSGEDAKNREEVFDVGNNDKRRRYRKEHVAEKKLSVSAPRIFKVRFEKPSVVSFFIGARYRLIQ